MKQRIMMTLITLLLFCGAASAAGTHSDWSAESIDKAVSAGLIPSEQYLGDYTKPISRGEIAALLIRAYEAVSGEDYIAEESPFIDVYSNEAAAVYELGIMNGRGEGEFAPYAETTRQEMAKIIYSFSKVMQGEEPTEPDAVPSSFSDYDEIADWAKPYVTAAAAEGIFSGYEDGTFRSTKQVTWEEAIALVVRTAQLPEKERPVITFPSYDSVISSGEETRVTVEGAEEYNLYAVMAATDYYLYPNHLGSSISAGRLEADSLYWIYAESDGVFSEPIRLYTDNYSLHLTMESFAEAGEKRVKWNRVPGVEVYTVTVTERRNSYYPEDIPPKDPQTYEIRWEDFITFATQPNRNYTVEITGGEYTASGEMYVSAVYYEDMGEIAASYPQSKEEADALMTTVTVPVWRLQNGKKVSSTASLTVHHRIADKVKLVFEEIYNGSEQFPIKDVGAYSWRGGTTEHNGGTAIDINANENYCIYNSGQTVGSHWKPYEDPYSIKPYGDVVNAFEKHGFTWGGDSWSNPKDYMHFSYLGT